MFFGETSRLFPKWLYQFIFPPTGQNDFIFSHLHQHLLSLVFYDSRFNRCKVISLWFWLFDLYFPDDWWCWTSFHVPIDHLYILSGKSIRDLVKSSTLFKSYFFLFFLFFVFFFCCCAVWVHYTFLIFNLLSDIWFANIFCWLFFHFVDGFLYYSEDFYLDIVLHVDFWFCGFCFRCHI